MFYNPFEDPILRGPVQGVHGYEAKGYKNVSYKAGAGRAMIGQTAYLKYSKAGSPATVYAPIYADMAIQPPAPAPAPAPPAPAPQQNLQIAQLTKEAQEYRAQAEETIGEAQAKITELSNEELQRQKAAELQNRLSIQAQASAARGAMAPSLKIATGSQPPQTAGTQSFRRRKDQFAPAPIQSTAGINVPTGSVLNI